MLLLLQLKYRTVISLLLLVAVVVALAQGSTTLTQAQSGGTTDFNSLSEKDKNLVANLCQVTYRNTAADMLAELYDELDAIGKNEDGIAEQVDEIYESFRDYRTELAEEAQDVIATIDPEDTPGANQVARAECGSIRDSATKVGRNVMRRFLNKASARKRDLVITEQYQSLINGSRKLVQELSAVNDSFRQFDTKVPCITNKCVKN